MGDIFSSEPDPPTVAEKNSSSEDNSSEDNSSDDNSSTVVEKVIDSNQITYLDRESEDVRRVVCCLENLGNIDIIVNSTDKSLNLNSGGQVSKTILSVAGAEIQNELNRKYPNGIKTCDIAVTGGYGLPYKYVYHCSLQSIDKRLSHHLLREVVAMCLRRAAAARHNYGPLSIAFPAIGTGCMNFPPRILKTIYCAILEFMEENPGSLAKAYISIHPEQEELIKYAKGIDPKLERERLNYPVNFPSSWSQTESICRIKLAKSDDEYSYVANKLKNTIGPSVRIIKIERIENKRLYIAHERYRNTLPSAQHTSKDLWHGTKHEIVDSIIRYGFDWRLTSRAVYGRGCYFAKEAAYSNNDTYSTPNGQGEKCMFLADVLVGNAIMGGGHINEANIPSNEQTTVNNLQNPTIFVTFNDDQVYPAFLVVYKET